MKNYFKMENGKYGSYLAEDCTEVKSEDAGLREVGDRKEDVLKDIRSQVGLIDDKIKDLTYIRDTLISDIMDVVVEKE